MTAGDPGDWSNVSDAPSKTSQVLDAVERLGKGFYQTSLKGAVDTLGAAGSAVMHPERTASAIASSHPIDAVVKAATDAYQTHANMLNQAKASFQKGDYPDAMDHAVNALVPIFGPANQAAIDKIKSGDVAGGVGEGLGNLFSLATVVPGAAEAALGKIGDVADALRITKPVKWAEQSTATKLYTSALKPSQVNPADAAAAVQTGLDSAIPVSAAGKVKLDALVQDLSTKVKNVIAADPTATVDPQAAAARIGATRARFASQVNPVSDVNTIDAAKQEFLTQAGAKPGKPAVPPAPTGVLDYQGNPVMSAGRTTQPPTPAPPMPAAQAQELKQGTYAQQSSKAYGEMKTAQIESEKALARGLREELETQFPELKSLNAAQAKLYTLDPYLERGIARIGNHNLVSLGDMVAGGAASSGGPAGMVGASVMRHVFGTPSFKSRLAIVLNKAAKTGGIPESVAATTARVNSFVQSLDSALSSGAQTTAMPGAALPQAAQGDQQQQP
jgi:hypothetical protein